MTSHITSTALGFLLAVVLVQNSGSLARLTGVHADGMKMSSVVRYSENPLRPPDVEESLTDVMRETKTRSTIMTSPVSLAREPSDPSHRLVVERTP